MSCSIEIWKPIQPGYDVSSHGRVRSLRKVLRPFLKGIKRSQYLAVELPGRKQIRVHRLVAFAFVPNPNGSPQVNHKDGNRKNNLSDNLEWVTASENTKHAYSTGLCHPASGELHGSAKLSPSKVRSIRSLRGVVSGAKLAKCFGVDKALISRVQLRKSWRHI